MKKCLIAAVMCSILISTTAQAGFMDKLKAATDKLNQASQNMKTGGSTVNQPNPNTQAGGAAEDPDHPLHLEDYDKTGSCEGKRSATCMDYMELADNCMKPLQGYRMKLTGDLIDKKLKKEKLNDKLRKNLEEDLIGVREAEKNKSDFPTIAGQTKSNRHLRDISEENQVWINAEYNQYYNKIYNKCMGADHMGVGHRTEMITDKGISGDEAVKQMKASRAKESEPFDCLKRVQGVRYTVMAEMMEKKLQTLKLSDQERAEWEADIAAVREVSQGDGTKMPTSGDPKNPMRPMMRLTDPNDMTQMSTETGKRSQEMIDACSKSGPQRPKQQLGSGTTTSQQKVLNEKNAKDKAAWDKKMKEPVGQGGSLSASLGATKLGYLRRDGVANCTDPIKGHMDKLRADKLEAKLKTVKLTAEQKRDWEADIASLRAAAEVGADQPDPVDPDNPYRWMDNLSKEDQQQINSEHSKFVNEIMKKCNSTNPMKD